MKKKIVSENDLKEDGELTLFEGQPFSGICCNYSENEQKDNETHYRDGKREGLDIEWYKNGKKERERSRLIVIIT